LGTSPAEVGDKELLYAHPPPQLTYLPGNCNPICNNANNEKLTNSGIKYLQNYRSSPYKIHFIFVESQIEKDIA
jgi:hypothetical protein